MKELTNQELKEVMLDVIQEFHDFCIDNDIKYSLCAGTLLGAIRHKGFIPWDDDIDVMMPRKEYNKFLEKYKSERYTLHHYSLQKPYMLSYAKLSDKRTIMKEQHVYDSQYGVNIDIFPLDFQPDNIEDAKKWARRLKFLKDIRSMKNLKVCRNRSLLKNVTIALCRILALPISMKWLVRKVDIIAQQYADKDDGYVGNMTNGLMYKERTPIAKGLIDVDFEGRKFKAVANYDEYLKGLFKDYMTPPPPEKRVTHHAFKAYWI